MYDPNKVCSTCKKWQCYTRKSQIAHCPNVPEGHEYDPTVFTDKGDTCGAWESMEPEPVLEPEPTLKPEPVGQSIMNEWRAWAQFYENDGI